MTGGPAAIPSGDVFAAVHTAIVTGVVPVLVAIVIALVLLVQVAIHLLDARRRCIVAEVSALEDQWALEPR